MEVFSITQPLFSNECLPFDGPTPFSDYTLAPLPSLTDSSISSFSGSDQQAPNWCTWWQGNVSSLSVIAVVPRVNLDPTSSGFLTIMQIEKPYAQHNADLIIQTLRALPTMMLRRNTFPWFVHSHAHLLTIQKEALPEALSTCMSVAQLFASRTAETKPILWCTVRAEYRGFLKKVRILSENCCLGLLMSFPNSQKMHNMSGFELLAALQACMIYLIMCIVDQSAESETSSLELLMVLRVCRLTYI